MNRYGMFPVARGDDTVDELQLDEHGELVRFEDHEAKLAEAIDLIVELGGAIDGGIASHLFPGVTGQNARKLSLKSRKWLSKNTRKAGT